MRRRSCLFLALFVFVLTFASSASAVPQLVELKVKASGASIDDGVIWGDDGVTLPGSTAGSGNGKGKGAGNGKADGNPSNSNGKNDLKSLTIWLSTDGKSWKSVDGDVVAIGSDLITARIKPKGGASPTDLFESFGLPEADITGETGPTVYLGLSSSSKSIEPGAFRTRLVSWNYQTTTRSVVSVPEPATWSLFVVGVAGLGVVLRNRRKR